MGLVLIILVCVCNQQALSSIKVSCKICRCMNGPSQTGMSFLGCGGGGGVEVGMRFLYDTA